MRNSITPKLNIGLLCIMFIVALASPVQSTELGKYSVADLMQTCEEGDNDARWSSELEVNCEQFIDGFTGAYLLLTNNGKSQSVCLPAPGNRSDEMRWAFVKWAYDNFDRRHMPAAEGLLEMVKIHFPCG